MEQALNSVSDVMRAGVLSVSDSTSLTNVARVMREHGVHGVLVVSSDGEACGWITAQGLLSHGAADWRHLRAGEAISEPCVGVAPSSSVPAAVDAMLAAATSRLLVMRPGSRTPDGVVTDLDLVSHLSR